MRMGIPGLQAHAVGAALAKGEHRLACHIFCSVYRRMLGTGDQHQHFIAQRHAIEPSQTGRAVHQRGIQAVSEQPLEQLATGRRTNLQVHRRIRLVITRQ
ncbi:hypothetical protein D3C71_1705450 [compost metagenome]